jgi:peptidyl-prolyl cis-trans isomerase SurA
VKRCLLALALLGGASLLSPGSAEAAIVDRIAAVVNKDVITLSEVYDLGGEYIEEAAIGEGSDGPRRRAAELEVLDALVQRALIGQEIQALGLDVTRDELERTIDDVARQNGLTREQLRGEVERSGLPWSEYRNELEENLREMKFNQVVILPRVTVTDDEVTDLYNRRVKSALGSELREFEAILLPVAPVADEASRAVVSERAAELRAQLDAGTTWPELLASTTDSALHSSGGKLGSFSEEEIIGELREPGFTLAVGAVSQPIQLPTGVILLRVAAEQAAEAPPLESVRPDLTQELQMTKVEAEVDLWYAQARRQAAVDIKLESAGGR